MSQNNKEPLEGSVPPDDEEAEQVPATPVKDIKSEQEDFSSAGSSVIIYTPSPKRVEVVTLDSDDDNDDEPNEIPAKEEFSYEDPEEPAHVSRPVERPRVPNPYRQLSPVLTSISLITPTRQPEGRRYSFPELSPSVSSNTQASPLRSSRDIFAGSSELFNANKDLPVPPPSQETDPDSRPVAPCRDVSMRSSQNSDSGRTAVVAPIRRLPAVSAPNRRASTPYRPMPPLRLHSQDESEGDAPNVTAATSAHSSQSNIPVVVRPRPKNTASHLSKRPVLKAYAPPAKKKKTAPPVKNRMSQEMRRLQQSADFMIPKLPFSRLVKDVTETVCDDMGIEMKKWQSGAMGAVQTAAECYLGSLFADGYVCALHAKRVTLMPTDIQLVLRLRSDDDPGKKRP